MRRFTPAYPSEFRAEAVHLVREGGKPLAEIVVGQHGTDIAADGGLANRVSNVLGHGFPFLVAANIARPRAPRQERGKGDVANT